MFTGREKKSTETSKNHMPAILSTEARTCAMKFKRLMMGSWGESGKKAEVNKKGVTLLHKSVKRYAIYSVTGVLFSSLPGLILPA